MRIINIVFIGSLFAIFSCNTKSSIYKEVSNEAIKLAVSEVLDNWHQAASEAQYDDYFNLMTSDGVFVGTDPTEHWSNKAFRTFSKPYFDKGKAWSFKAVERHVYLSEDKKMAWFDELLDTQMKLCRGSGVLKFENNQWKIAHYVLSIAIPNENTKQVIELKKDFDDNLLLKLKK